MAQQFAPLRVAGEEAGPESAESLLISALLYEGTFVPEKYRVTIEDLSCWLQLWHFCVEHQQRTGAAPSIELVKRRFPEFEPTPGIKAQWAAAMLHKEAAGRRIRVGMREAIMHLDQGDVTEAYGVIRGLPPLKTARKPVQDGFTAWDDQAAEDERLEVPYPSLGRATGGIGKGELWYSAGRPGVGKTFTVCHYAAKALQTGASVVYVSLEMPSRVISKRIMRDLASKEPAILKLLDDEGLNRQKGLAKVRNLTPGRLSIIDPSHGRATSLLMRELMEEHDLVIIDHVGLMSTADGRRAIDDWRAMATISNQLKEDVLATDHSVLAAAQLNRDAESDAPRAPKASTLSQSKALEEDGDVVITQKRLSPRVMIQAAVKVREGPPAGWHSIFDPVKALFHEITPAQAQDLISADDDREARLKS